MDRPFSQGSGSRQNQLESLVFAGAYEEVVRRAAEGYSDLEAPAVIGALALGGRLEESESVFDARFRGGSRGSVPASARFFLAAGFCHAGNSERALRYARENLTSLRGGPAQERYWAYQGLALVRHFEGRLGRARRAARRALMAAIEAGFEYGRFLSLDLSLGYNENAATERAAPRLFELRFALGLGNAALAAVRELVSASGVSYFTRRNGWLELSAAHALRGEGALAAEALEAARRIALPGSDRRARVRWLIGHALCMALARGADEARTSLREAQREAREELTLRAEIGFIEAMFLAPLSVAARSELQSLAAQTGAERAKVAWLLGAEARSFAARIEDGLCRLLLECVPLQPVERLRRVTDAHFLGLVPWALGLAPGRRIIVLGALLISENQGNVAAAELKNRPALKLLFTLARGYRSRSDLLRDVWNIAHFVPARHTPTLHTAVSRLRYALGALDWVMTHDDGYSLAAGVEVLSFGDADAGGVSLQVDATFSIPPPPDERQRVLDHVSKEGPLSSAEVARALRLSGSTALRLLRALTEEGLLERKGGGRSTRYGRK
jgi:hypothetical protein